MAGTSSAKTRFALLPGHDANISCILRLSSEEAGSGDQFREQIRVDIASGENDDDVLAACVDAAGQKGGEADRGARLGHELHLAKCKPDRGADVPIGGVEALRREPA